MNPACGPGQVYAVGFGTHRGTVIAGSSWGARMEAVPVPDASRNSWEDLMHRAGSNDKALIFDERAEFMFEDFINHRAIGVVYDPRDERGNYIPTIVPKRYDAFVYVDESRALEPIPVQRILV